MVHQTSMLPAMVVPAVLPGRTADFRTGIKSFGGEDDNSTNLGGENDNRMLEKRPWTAFCNIACLDHFIALINRKWSGKWSMVPENGPFPVKMIHFLWKMIHFPVENGPFSCGRIIHFRVENGPFSVREMVNSSNGRLVGGRSSSDPVLASGEGHLQDPFNRPSACLLGPVSTMFASSYPSAWCR